MTRLDDSLIDTSKNPKGMSDVQMGVIIECHMKGMTPNEIAMALERRTGKQSSPNSIRAVITEQNALWRVRNERGTDFYMNQELDRLQVMEREAWRQYELCGGKVIREQTTEFFDANDEVKERTVTTEVKDDPKTARDWFITILDIQQARRRLLKLDRVISVQTTLIEQKAYVGWNPDKEWPDPPEQLDDPTVIEGETVE